MTYIVCIPSYSGKLVIGVKGLTQQRQYIMEQWPEGKHIVFLEDDIASIDLSISDVFKEQTLGYFFQEAFREIEKRRSYGVCIPFSILILERLFLKRRHTWPILLVHFMGLLTDPN